jgi:hypothetical protein
MCVHLLHNSALTVDWWDVAQVTIDMLPDIALLEIFVFFWVKDAMRKTTGYRRGSRWCTCAKNGETLFLSLHVAWICNFTAQPAPR